MKEVYLNSGRCSGKSYKQAKLMRERIDKMKGLKHDDPQIDILEYNLKSVEPCMWIDEAENVTIDEFEECDRLIRANKRYINSNFMIEIKGKNFNKDRNKSTSIIDTVYVEGTYKELIFEGMETNFEKDEMEKFLKTIIEYEENCELKYDRFMKNSKPIPKGERLIDFAIKNNVNFEECKRLYNTYDLKDIKRMVRAK